MNNETLSKNRIILALVSILIGLVLASLAMAQTLVVNAALVCIVIVAAILCVKIFTASRDDGVRIMILVLGIVFGIVAVVLVPQLRLTTLDTNQLVLIFLGLFLVYKV